MITRLAANTATSLHHRRHLSPTLTHATIDGRHSAHRLLVELEAEAVQACSCHDDTELQVCFSAYFS